MSEYRQRLSKNKVGIWLFPALLASALMQNYFDLTSILSGEALGLNIYEGPIIYKVGKDIVYFLLLFGIIKMATRLGRLPLDSFSGAIIGFIFILYITSLVFNGFIVATSGLRWALPLILFLLLRDWAFSLYTGTAVRWLLAGLVVCLIAQVYQLFNMPPVFGEVYPGIPARTPGIFLAPNSTAFFACAAAACIMVFSPDDHAVKRMALTMALLISALAQSGTGLIVAATLILWALLYRNTIVFWLMIGITVSLVLPNLDRLTMRENYVEVSGGGRIDIITDIAAKSAFSVSSFGLYTNTANLLNDSPQDQTAPDSLWASWVGNFGLLALLQFCLLSLFVLFSMHKIDWRRAMPCVLVFLMFSFTTIVFEAFPMNMLLAIGLWTARKPNQAVRRLQLAKRS